MRVRDRAALGEGCCSCARASVAAWPPRTPAPDENQASAGTRLGATTHLLRRKGGSAPGPIDFYASAQLRARLTPTARAAAAVETGSDRSSGTARGPVEPDIAMVGRSQPAGTTARRPRRLAYYMGLLPASPRGPHEVRHARRRHTLQEETPRPAPPRRPQQARHDRTRGCPQRGESGAWRPAFRATQGKQPSSLTYPRRDKSRAAGNRTTPPTHAPKEDQPKAAGMAQSVARPVAR
jgi:hypothetical protein